MSRMLRRGSFLAAALCAMELSAVAQQISDSAKQQMAAVLQVKASMTAAQKKESTSLILSAMTARQQSLGAIPNSLVDTSSIRAGGTVLVDIGANVSGAVLQQIGAVGGQVVYSSVRNHAIRANLPLLSVDTIAALDDVRWIRPADLAVTNGNASRYPMSMSRWLSAMRTNFFIGSVTSQGYVTHTANKVVSMGINGSGVNVGVLSDSATPDEVSALIASGDLPPGVTVVPGQTGNGENEGTAMMEIVHDLAPGAQLFFATAFSGQSSFADNIRTLRFTYHCDVIVDDVTYFAEGAFQDGTIAQAVNDVVADGALYFSSAANSGNLTFGTSGTWEGDFQSGGDAGPGIDGFEGQPVAIQNFGTAANPQLYDVLTSTGTGGISLKWSDPLGAANDDYDLFVFDSTGTVLKGFSGAAQTGTQDPFEFVGIGSNCGTAQASGYCPAVGDRIVVVLFAGSPKALRLDTNRGALSIATAGSTFGHNAGANTITMAATAWNSAHAGTRPFTGAQNPIEVFSSDGPRQIFFNPDGTEITPGNDLLGTNGGTILQKPDATAADGVFTKTPGFLPFFGTSAAAPHAAAIAALVKSARPGLTNTQIKQVLLNTALDTMAPGVDRDSGSGILMALPAVQAALALP